MILFSTPKFGVWKNSKFDFSSHGSNDFDQVGTWEETFISSMLIATSVTSISTDVTELIPRLTFVKIARITFFTLENFPADGDFFFNLIHHKV